MSLFRRRNLGGPRLDGQTRNRRTAMLMSAPQHPHNERQQQHGQSNQHPIFDMGNDLVHQAIPVLGEFVAEEHKKSAADDGGETVGDNELEEIESRSARDNNHCSAYAGEKSAYDDDPNAVASEPIFDARHPFDVYMTPNKRDFCNFGPKAFPEGVKDAVAANDSAPSAKRGQRQVHVAALDEESRCDEGNVFGQWKSNAAEQKDAEQSRTSAAMDRMMDQMKNSLIERKWLLHVRDELHCCVHDDEIRQM